MPTVKETFDAMASRFRTDKAAGTNAVIQYDVSGDGGGTWHAVIKDGACTVKPGAGTNPNLSLQISAQDWLDMLSGNTNPSWDRAEIVTIQQNLTANAPRLMPAIDQLLSYVHQRTLQRLTLEAARDSRLEG